MSLFDGLPQPWRRRLERFLRDLTDARCLHRAIPIDPESVAYQEQARHAERAIEELFREVGLIDHEGKRRVISARKLRDNLTRTMGPLRKARAQ